MHVIEIKPFYVYLLMQCAFASKEQFYERKSYSFELLPRKERDREGELSSADS